MSFSLQGVLIHSEVYTTLLKTCFYQAKLVDHAQAFDFVRGAVPRINPWVGRDEVSRLKKDVTQYGIVSGHSVGTQILLCNLPSVHRVSVVILQVLPLKNPVRFKDYAR